MPGRGSRCGSFEQFVERLQLGIGEKKLFPAIRAKREEQIIIAPGGSCRNQIMDGTGHMAKHPIEVIAELIKED